MSDPGPLAWLKLWARQTIHGTTTKELDPAERWCWIGYLCLAASSPLPGTICVADGLPYTTHQLAQLLAVSPAVLKRATEKMVASDKISVSTEGILITNWRHYQADYARVRKHRQRVSSETPDPAVTDETDSRRGRGRGERGEEETSSSSATDARVAELVRVYEANIGAITPLVAQELGDLADDYAVGWFEAAVKEALAANVRSLKYVKAILQRWSRDGFKTPLRRQPAGGAGAHAKKPLPSTPQLEDGWGTAHEQGKSQ